MPKEAWEIGAAERLVSLDSVVDELLSCLADAPGASTARGTRP
jgi:hypothetical protein